MKKTTAKKTTRIYPRFVKVYFKDTQTELLDEIQKLAKENNISLSTCANMILAAGTAIVSQDLQKMEYLKRPLKKSDAY